MQLCDRVNIEDKSCNANNEHARVANRIVENTEDKNNAKEEGCCSTKAGTWRAEYLGIWNGLDRFLCCTILLSTINFEVLAEDKIWILGVFKVQKTEREMPFDCYQLI